MLKIDYADLKLYYKLEIKITGDSGNKDLNFDTSALALSYTRLLLDKLILKLLLNDTDFYSLT